VGHSASIHQAQRADAEVKKHLSNTSRFLADFAVIISPRKMRISAKKILIGNEERYFEAGICIRSGSYIDPGIVLYWFGTPGNVDMRSKIVDDVASNRILLERIVRNKFGCDIIHATNGKEALALLPSQIPNILLLDLQMPEMSGFELLQILRRSEEWKTLPVVIISAIGDRSRTEEIASLGVSGYLLKPFSAIDVSERIVDALKKAHKAIS